MTQEKLLSLIDQAAAEGWTELDLSGKGLTELPGAIAYSPIRICYFCPKSKMKGLLLTGKKKSVHLRKAFNKLRNG